jgi:lipopolysaccharide/colanic/teichoic acid biosynthesis glycosyltransferase
MKSPFMYQRFFKPLLDFTISLFLLLILFPFILILLLLVYFDVGRPVLFIQLRPGKVEKVFKLYKFRTMTDDRDISGELLVDIKRITKFGIFLRRTSLDELPQLFNILKGDLSFIGPRPLLVEYLPLYKENQKKRHNVKPGITGWAQVNGRNSISWDEKFKLDVYYVENLSFLLDLKILFRTLINVLRASDIYNSNGITMEKFTGSKL